MKLSQKALCLASVLLALVSLAPFASAQTVNQLVISQVYGGGGNASASYKNDFVELFNPTSGPISTHGYTIQYASSASGFAVAATLPDFPLQPGGYYLIGFAGGSNGATLPTPDATGTTNLNATVGKVALVLGTTALTSCAGYVDEVGYGTSTMVCAETSAATAPPNNAGSIARSNLCKGTNNNSADFVVQAANPHNSSVNAGACVSANPAASITAAGYPSPTNRGVAHGFTVTAKDSSGNAASSYTGTVTLTSSDPAATFAPVSHTFVAADAGTYTFSVTLNTTGTQSITATDTTNNLTASQTGIVVNGTVWIVNNNTTVTHLTQGGAVLSTAGTSGATATAAGIVVSNSGYAFAVANSASNVTEYNASGAVAFTSTVGGINLPTSIALDGAGNLWIANANNTLSALSESTTSTPVALSPATGYIGGALSTPSAIAVDSTGSVWVTNAGSASFTRFFGAAAPTITPIATSTANSTQGTRP